MLLRRGVCTVQHSCMCMWTCHLFIMTYDSWGLLEYRIHLYHTRPCAYQWFLIQTAELIQNFEMKPDTYFIIQTNILFTFQISMCDKSRNTWLCVHWQWNTLEWCQLNALQASPVVHLVTPLSCVSLSMNTQPSVPAIETHSQLKK